MRILFELVQRFEGMARKLPNGLIGPYLCPAGVPTQGLGVVVADLKVPPITEDEARARCLAVLPYYVGETLKLCPNLANAPPGVLEAVADFTYNLGAGRLRASTLRRALLAEDWVWAMAELRKWTRGGGRVLPGLVRRREAECAVIAAAVGLQD